MKMRPLTAAGLVLACTLHCMVGAADLSSSKSWLCGVWITGDELSAPLARYFNFPQLFRTKCPIEKDTRKFAKLCQKVGGQWEKSWSPTKRGFRGMEGDNVCKAVQKELGVDDVPNELFPQGIRLGYFYNFCGIDEWTFSGRMRQGDSLCCKDGSYISCEGIVETSGKPTGSLFSGGQEFLNIFVGNKSVIPLSQNTEPQYFGPVEFKLEIANNENIILSQTIPFTSILGEDNSQWSVLKVIVEDFIENQITKKMQGTSRNYAMQMLAKQLKDCQDRDDISASIGLENDDDLFLWNVVFEGPEDTLYEGGYFKAQLKFPDDYPNNPPNMIFKTKMWHPNIYPDGKVCISILHAPGEDSQNAQETAEERWRPIIGVEAILISVISMLNDPNIESPANLDASLQFRDDNASYKKKVRQLTAKSIDDI